MSAVVVEPDPVQLEQIELPNAEPCVVVIFGATGDLTKRKLMPALCRLTEQGCLESVRVLGVGRSTMSDEEFQTLVHDALKDSKKIGHLDDEAWGKFSTHLHYLSGELDAETTYQHVGERLEALANEGGSRNHLFYLATPPALFSTIVKRLGEAGLNKEDGHWSRVIIEKPFGRDLESAKALNATVSAVFKESQIYRIDHYLGKDTVQNILVSASATRCLSRSGIAITWITSRSRRRKLWVWAVARVTTKMRARCATWSRTTCCNC